MVETDFEQASQFRAAGIEQRAIGEVAIVFWHLQLVEEAARLEIFEHHIVRRDDNVLAVQILCNITTELFKKKRKATNSG